MKKAKLIFTIFLCIASFSIVKSQYKGLNSFFESDNTLHPLSTFINSSKIIIVDQKNKIFPTEKEFKYQSKSGEQIIKILILYQKKRTIYC